MFQHSSVGFIFVASSACVSVLFLQSGDWGAVLSMHLIQISFIPSVGLRVIVFQYDICNITFGTLLLVHQCSWPADPAAIPARMEAPAET